VLGPIRCSLPGLTGPALKGCSFPGRIHGDAVRTRPRGLSWTKDHTSEGTDMGTDVWVVVVIGVVLLFGATKLPQIARNLGKAQGEFKKGIKEGHVEDASTPPPAAPTPPAQAQADPPVEGDTPTA
jgi:sec-independent protein translocase protein TatA